MDTDLILTMGIVLLVLSVPSLLSAWVEGKPPRVGGLLILAAFAMIVTATLVRPGGYDLNDVPSIMIGVVSRWFN
jgi:formate-dependent nitrite reductase membrane component NrfD